MCQQGDYYMHYYQDYSSADKTREQHDEQAIKDLLDFLSPRQQAVLMEMTTGGDGGYEAALSIQGINIGMGLAGVSGRPFFAWCRKYRLADFREWCRDPEHGGARETDEQGFFLPEERVADPDSTDTITDVETRREDRLRK
jgi:hypothetical protein